MKVRGLVGEDVGAFVETPDHLVREAGLPCQRLHVCRSPGPGDPIRAESSGSSLGMPVDVAVVAVQRLAWEVEGVVVLVKKLDP